MDKFNRNYLLEVQKSVGSGLITKTSTALERLTDLENSTITGDSVVVQPPFTIEFDITRNILTSANVCQIRIYNLSEHTRNFIRHNPFDYASYRAVRLKAGYGDNLATIFQGNVTSAWSTRQGVDFITQLECMDGGFAFNNGLANFNIPAGITLRNAIILLGEQLPHADVGAIGNYAGTLARSSAYNGNLMQVINDLAGGGAFIDLEKLNALRDNEYIASPGQTVTINAQSGLLGTPVLQNGYLHFDMLFEPFLQIGQKALLQSTTEKSFNGEWIVQAVKHRGTISRAICGDAITTVTLLLLSDAIAIPSLSQ